MIEKNFEPSRGGIGIRLRNPNAKLNLITSKRTAVISGDEEPTRWRRMAATQARAKFVSGPASATSAISFLPSRSMRGLTGTGFAAPNTRGEPDNIRSNGTTILIIGSMWGIGLRVSLPAMRAVGSPNFSATKPCAIS